MKQVQLATSDPDLQMRVIAAMTGFLAESFDEHSVPSHLGTDRDLLVQKMTGVDPYEALKHESNQIAMRMLPELKAFIESAPNPSDRFRRATLVAAAANAIEFDVAGRDFRLDDLKEVMTKAESDLEVDHISAFRQLCRKAKHVTYLLDNSGEVVLDMLLIAEIRRLGPKVVAVVRGGPVLNDATSVDAEEVGLAACADDVMDTGAPTIGIILDRVSDEFKRLLFSSDLVVAKGMGNYESLTEIELNCPVVYIMRTKCLPVAHDVGVARNKNVVLVRNTNRQLKGRKKTHAMS